MSAIFGVVSLDGCPVAPDTLNRMAAALAHRGPDGCYLWRDGAAGLGHLMLRSTPESLHERLPATDGHAVAITADARLDNRVDLLAILHPDVGREVITDAQLILLAYRKWGAACAEHLLGDFAFAIWDRERSTLYCARDHFGVKPLYWGQVGHAFVFASEIKGVLAVPGMPRRLNEDRVVEYLTHMFSDATNTFYQDVTRLAPGHAIRVGPTGIATTSYWSLDQTAETRLGSDREYAEALRHHLTVAVRDRLRSAFPVGSTLSGGLDSSAVTAIARNYLQEDRTRRLHTFSQLFDDVPRCDERGYIEPILAQNGVVPTYTRGDQHGLLTHVDRMLWHEDEPYFGPNLFLTWSLFERVQQCGVRVLLDGLDGDTTVSHGVKHLTVLARSGQWLPLVRSSGAVSDLYGESRGRLVWGYWRQFALEPVLEHSRLLQPLRRGVRKLWSQFSVAGLPSRQDRETTPPWLPFLNPDFARRANLGQRGHEWWERNPISALTERESHYRAITQPLQPLSLEVCNHAAAAFSLDVRHPFWDKRLVEFCLALPPSQKISGDGTRVILRRAMEGLLPPKVQWRRGKVDFLPVFLRGLTGFDQDRLNQVMRRDLATIGAYVNLGALEECYTRLTGPGPAPADPNGAFMVWRAASLTLWLKSGAISG